MKILKVMGNIYDHIINYLYYFVGVLLVFVMCTITYAVISRYFFSKPIGWISEISGYILIPLAVLAAPVLLRDGGHIKVDVITNLVSKKVNSVLTIITSFLGSALFLVITWFGLKVTADMYAKNYLTDTFLSVPKFILVGIVTLGVFLITIQYARNCGIEIRKLYKKHDESEK